MADMFGPLMMLRGRLAGTGEWEPLREKLAALYDQRIPAEYLVTLGRKAN
jgi:hypothetical protein